ncbi:MAG TPA: ferrous iron transport protein B [Candidatus Sulfomarinibacteraceae bacterium]|nr:ferrous iron transport protein B [Candidatus Sulfomarinibacteraceae bacterium]
MRFVLAGQPNAGKSSIFNSVAGYRSATANFPRSSITYTVTKALIAGREVEVVDLPGAYSLTSTEAAAGPAERYLLDQPYDLIIDVVDASRLGRSLEMTLQLIELGRPMIIALNMMDEARRRGIVVDHRALAAELGVPVVPTVSRLGRGLKQLFRDALRHAVIGHPAPPLPYDLEVEEAIADVVDSFDGETPAEGIPSRFVATKLLEADPHVSQRVYRALPELERQVNGVAAGLEQAHGWTADQVVSGSRHAVAHGIEDRVVSHREPRLGWREWADRLLLDEWTGGPLMLVILGLLFWFVFGVGKRVEEPLVEAFNRIQAAVAAQFPPDSLVATVADGLVMGLAGGVAIVLPYLLPFLIGLAVLEDTGYLPRLAYILDSLMHRVGLHGTSVLPLILGYGCSVPAIMATRILESEKDRRITAVLASFIPCSARTVVIFGLVAAFMGPLWAVFIYLLNIVVIVVIGTFLARRMAGTSPGLVLEIPDLSLPDLRTLAAKTWLTLKEFITIAWPLLIASSIVLGVLEWAEAADDINALLSPLTVWVLGLPAAVGMTLVFGVLRKELTLVMLVQALGTTEVDAVMSSGQLMTFTLFVVFYVPCIATIAVLARQLGWRDTGLIAGFTVVVAVAISVAGRLVFSLFV